MPTVTLAPGASVGIDPANNTVTLDPATLVSETASVFNQTAIVSSETVTLGPVDVSTFKQIRIIVAHESLLNPFCPVEIFPHVRYGQESFKKSRLDVAKLNNMNEMYELPGPAVEVSLRGLGPGACGEVMRVVVYGRSD